MRTTQSLVHWKFSVILFLKAIAEGSPLNLNLQEKVCRTEECIDTASLILSNMDPKISPCDDFYKFACGRYKTLTNETTSYSMQNALLKIVSPQLDDIFMPKEYHHLEPGLQKAYTFYNACMHVSLPLSKANDLILEKIPDLNFWNPIIHRPKIEESEQSYWIELIEKSRNFGLETNFIVTVVLAFNPDDSSNYILRILPPSVDTKGWKFIHSFSPEISNQMKNALKQPDIVGNTQKFQRQLNNMLPQPSSSLTEYWHQTYITTVSNLQNEYSSINWMKLLQATVGSIFNITESQIVSVHSRGFVSNLEKLLSQTPTRTVSNYLKFRILNKWTDIALDFYPIQKEKNCRANTHLLFGKVVILKLLKSFYREEKKRALQDMIAMIKEEMRNSFWKSTWINNEVRQKLLGKLNAIKETIGSDEEIARLNKRINSIYNNLKLNSNDYFDSLLNVIKLGIDIKFSVLHDPFFLQIQRLDQTNWPTAPFYQVNREIIIVPGSYLVNVMYTPNRPNYLNFGFIGSILGHELLHAFQQNGIYIDEYGNVEEMWTSDIGHEYSKKMECLVNKYNNLSIIGTDKNVNGSRTLHENLADNEGVKAAYRAYKSWIIQQQQDEESLPNLNYTSSQMFWITNANLWCTYFPKQVLMNKVPTYTHAPPWDRVNAVFANLDEFVADFGCKTNSKMNAVQKCSVW